MPDGQTGTHHGSLGRDLRAVRRARGVTLVDLAARLDRSVGWLSQVERDISAPGVDDLRRISEELSVPMSMFFAAEAGPEVERGRVVRAGTRRKIGSRDAGLIEELLSPDLTDDFEVVHSTFLPGARLSKPTTRPTQEVGYVVAGRLRVMIGRDAFDVGPGDSFRIRGEAHRWENLWDEPAVLVWVIAPPVY
jgi:transcriptional regulator with XRE-family HTH domain